MKVYSSKLFSFDHSSRSISVDASILDRLNGEEINPALFYMHEDPAFACYGTGLAIQSEKTGKVEFFYVRSVVRADGDILDWQLAPVSKELSDLGWFVQVFND